MPVYEKREVKLPRLAGGALSALAVAVDTPGLGPVLREQMMGNLGITQLRARHTDEAQWSAAALFPATGPRATEAPVDVDAVARAVAGAEVADVPSAARLAAKYRARELSPVDVAEKVIAAIAQSEQHAPPFRFLIAHDASDVRAQAKASAERLAQGKPLSALDGVPVAVKDEVDQRGYVTTGGTRYVQAEGGKPATSDAAAVERLRAAGAVLIGKANMHELGIGTTGLNPHHGTARNPHDAGRHTGGSSSGSGAIVASGIVPLALGADGGGSIRNPASLCGVVGLKATFGRVSERGAVPICWSVAHIGPLGATVADCALGYAVMAGPDAHDEHSLRQPPVTVPALTGDVKGMRLGVFRPWIEDADADVVSAVGATLAALEKRGAVLVDVEIPDLELLRVVHSVTIILEMAAAQGERFHARKQLYAKDTRINFALARGLSATDYVHAQRHRTTLCRHFAEVLSRVDAIVSPSVGCTAPTVKADAVKSGESDLALLFKIMRFAPAANLTGLPAISVPCGRGDGGLPVGFMALGRAFDEARLFQIARAVELDVGWLKPKHHHALW